jgi:hypothetical protein
MKRFEPRVEDLVLLVLPVGAGGVAEEEAAGEGANLVDRAEFVDLKRTALAGPVGIGSRLKVVEERREFEGGDVEAVAEFFEAAAAATDDAEGTAGVDLGLEVVIDLVDGGADIMALRSREDRIAGLIELGGGELKHFQCIIVRFWLKPSPLPSPGVPGDGVNVEHSTLNVKARVMD